MATCGGCDYTYREIVRLLVDSEKTKDLLVAHNLVNSNITCPKCDSLLELKDKLIFRCDRKRRVTRNKKKVVERCNFYKSARKGTWFSNSKLSVDDIVSLTFLWTRTARTVKECVRELRCSKTTVIDWYSFCREVAINYCIETSVKLGGIGKVVEVDEAKFGKRKFNCGRVIEGTWVVGGIERGSRNIFLATVDSRDEQTLMKVLQDNVLPGTHVITDCWKSYNNLEKYGYQHSTVNHSQNFVDPVSGAHTQNIEREWREVRARIPRFGRAKQHFAGYLAESIFKRKFPDEGDRFHQFLLHAAKLYPPQ